jgi:hypothetical protein
MINIINVDPFLKKMKAEGPVISNQLFLGKGSAFHPGGLLSEDIFGIYGSPERRNSVSWIELSCPIIHPAIYDLLYKRIEKKIEDLLNGEKAFTIDENGVLVEDENGEITGMTSLYNNISRIRFRDSDDDESDRNKIITMLYKNIKQNIKIIVTINDIKTKYFKEKRISKQLQIHNENKVGVINCLWANSLGVGGILSASAKFIPSSKFLDLKLTAQYGFTSVGAGVLTPALIVCPSNSAFSSSVKSVTSIPISISPSSAYTSTV